MVKVINQGLLKQLLTRAFALNAMAKQGHGSPLLKNLECAISRAVRERMPGPQDEASRTYWARVCWRNLGQYSRERARVRKAQAEERKRKEERKAKIQAAQLQLFDS